jgi:hypothetical protein
MFIASHSDDNGRREITDTMFARICLLDVEGDRSPRVGAALTQFSPHEFRVLIASYTVIHSAVCAAD